MSITNDVYFRAPRASDAARVWALVRASRGLEPNSAYAYVLLCTHFAATSMVAQSDSAIVGFVGAYRPPTRPDALFVWQIGVDSGMRGKRVGSRLLHAVLRREGCRGVRFLEATVTPSNHASAALFRSLARDLGCGCEESPGFPRELFPGGEHEEEILFRVGPFSGPTKPSTRSEP